MADANVSLPHGSPTVIQLRCVLAVADTGSFTAGAVRVSLSQPALSRSVREVERILGIRIFERTTREVLATRDGAQFVAVARDILDHFDGGLARFASYRSGVLGSLSVAALPSMASAVMPEAAARFRGGHPDVQVHILEGNATEVLQQLRDGRAEVGLTERPEPGRQPSSESRPDAELRFVDVGADDVVLVARADHLLAARRSVRWRELANESFILFQPGTSLRALSDQAFAQCGAYPTGTTETPSVTTAAGMIRAGLGIAAVTRSVLPLLELAHPVAVPLVSPAIARPLAIVFRREPALSPAASAFVEVLRAMLLTHHGGQSIVAGR